MSIIKWNNRQHPASVFNHFVDNFFTKDLKPFFGRESFSQAPLVNISETDEAYKIAVAAPGLQKEHFKLELDNDVLTISAEQSQENEEKNEKYTRQEFGYSSFSRSFSLPKTVETDKIEASYTDGILDIQLPKKESEQKKPAKTINIG